ncbi:hypothetical protein X737_09900 [Mesorhizobium sp. L48C026A00]|nr:hypothetical protein X737_09900 [Mesorhizobium sp. L48C026A00]
MMSHVEGYTTTPAAIESNRIFGEAARKRLLTGLPIAERRLEMAGISTELLEGGAGPPIVLLHGPGEHAAKWLRILPELVRTHHVIAPDLPGHGASGTIEGPVHSDRVLAWLGELIERTCPTPPILVGQILGAAIAARFAAKHGNKLRCMVLSDALGSRRFSRRLNSVRRSPRSSRSQVRKTMTASGSSAPLTSTRCAIIWARAGSGCKPTILIARRHQS